ncbi:MAG: acetylornithine transaminase [Deltaproteobacteria bacterium]|nr:acetylornithine transaminase [Deltaproteobacteria bacterium]
MASIVDRARAVFTNNYRQQPVAFVRGEGVYVFDEAGRRYLDLLGGVAVNGLGHCHPAVVAAIREQAARLLHVSNLYYNEPSVALSEKLVALTEPVGLARVFLCNSGTEANEAALKLAKRFQTMVRGEAERVEVVAATGSFHGRTVGSLSATGQPKYHEGFGPLVPGVKFVPYGDLAAMQAAVDEKTAAVILEPLQGESGVVVPPESYLRDVRFICSRRGALLILDEVQTGCGRTGTFLAAEGFSVKPDIVTLAKGLGGGLPIGAMLATEEAAAGFVPGAHASTFGGNPVTSAAALAAVCVISSVETLANVRARGDEIRAAFKAFLAGAPGVINDVRGRGLLVGVELAHEKADAVVAHLRDNAVLANAIHNRVVRLAPPYIITREQSAEAVRAVIASIKAVGAAP